MDLVFTLKGFKKNMINIHIYIKRALEKHNYSFVAIPVVTPNEEFIEYYNCDKNIDKIIYRLMEDICMDKEELEELHGLNIPKNQKKIGDIHVKNW